MDWRLVFSVLLHNREIFFEFIDQIDENMFKDVVLSNIYILMKKFVSKYKRIPDLDSLQLLLDRLPEAEKERNLQKYRDTLKDISDVKVDLDMEVFRDQLIKAVTNYEMEKFILKTAEKVGEINFEDVMNHLRQVMSKSTPRNLGVDVTEVAQTIQLIRHDVTEKITSGMPTLDKLLYGGFGTNEIAIAMAPPGRGKSFFLLNMMYNAMLSGKNVLYITLELSEKSVAKRLYSRIAYASRKEMLDEDTITRSANKFFTIAKSKGRIIYHPSKSLTVEGIESLIEQYKFYFDFSPDLLIVDYLDLLAPRRSDFKLELRQTLRNITDELRSIALRRGIAVLTATQANRASLAKPKITEANVSESFGKVEVSDIILAISQTEEEKNQKRARLILLKNRDYVSGGCIECYVDFDKMILMDVDMAGKMGLLDMEVEIKT
jgi:replicative DNA helicase